MPERLRSSSDDLAAVVLAAGVSARMGRPKALLPWDGGTFFGEVAATIAAERLAVSVAVINPELAAELAELGGFTAVVPNAEPHLGQLHSLQLGLAKLAEADRPLAGFFLFLVDNPGQLRERTAMLRHWLDRDRSLLLTAGHGGVPGHPLWVPRRLWPAIAQYRGPGGLRGFFEATGEHPRVVETTAEALHDVDTPEDFGRLGG